MNTVTLYLILLKATVSSFSGLSSLPIIRDELVVNRHALTDQQLNAAVAVGRTTPGPMGVYVVSVGYFVGGIPGAVAGWLAMVTPALLVVPLIRFFGARAERPIIRDALSGVVLSSVGLILYAMLPMASGSVTGVVPVVLAVGSCAVLVLKRINPAWAVLASATVMLAATRIGL